MLSLAVRRIALFLPMLAGVVVLVFLLVHLIPGDPAHVLLGPEASPQAIASLRHSLGLDRPWPEQLTRYVRHLLRGDLGRSIAQDASVASLIVARLPATLELTACAMLIAIALGLGLASCATRQGSWIDLACLDLRAARRIGDGVSARYPAMYVFSVRLRLAAGDRAGHPVAERNPGNSAQGRPGVLANSLAHLAMPALALGLQGAALICRLVRAAMIEALSADYIRTARAKGVRDRRVVGRHALRNALLPAITLVGWQFGNLLGGAVLTEGIFGWPWYGATRGRRHLTA